MQYKVKVLRKGFTIQNSADSFQSNGTITLISGNKNIIVDTGSPWDKQLIPDLLKAENLTPENINIVINTHGHIDHCGNNNFFPDADFYSSFDICINKNYIFHDFSSGAPYSIDDDIQIIPTPGHTPQDISVIVKTGSGIIAIAGDLFENENDAAEDSWKLFSLNPETQTQSRKKILSIANQIIPGHGDIFKV